MITAKKISSISILCTCLYHTIIQRWKTEGELILIVQNCNSAKHNDCKLTPIFYAHSEDCKNTKWFRSKLQTMKKPPGSNFQMHPYSNFAVYLSNKIYLKRLPKGPIWTYTHTHA